MRAQELSEPRHAQGERPNGTDICRVATTERLGGRASAVLNTYWSSDQPSERSRPEQDAEWRAKSAPRSVWTPTETCWRSGRRDALWRVGGRGTLFALLEKGVALRRLLYVWFDFGFLSSAKVVILTATHRRTPWVCQSIRVIAAVAEWMWKLFYTFDVRTISVAPGSSSASSFRRLCSSLHCPGLGLGVTA